MDLNKYVSTNNMDMWSPEEWEAYLNKTEGNIDDELKISSKDTNSKILNILSVNDFNNYIIDFENSNNIRVNILENEGSISFFDKDNGNLIREIKTGNYTYNGISKSNHLFYVVNGDYKGNKYGKKLIELYSKAETLGLGNFKIPEEEFTHTPSMMKLLIDFGYKPTGYYIGGEYFNLSESELFELYEKLSGGNIEDDNFGFTYKLELDK